MKPFPCLSRGLLALALGLAVLPTWADDDCDAPIHRWQSREAVHQWAAKQGWEIWRLKIDDGCYDIRGTTKEGYAFKARIDPETLKVLKIRQGGRERAREHGRGHDREHDQATPPTVSSPPDGAAVQSPLLTPDAARQD